MTIAQQLGERAENLAKRESRGAFLKFAFMVCQVWQRVSGARLC